MYFRILQDERCGTVSYLLADLDAAEAVVIDPRGCDVPVLGAMLDEHKLRLRCLLRTHEHDACVPGEAAALDSLMVPRIQNALPADNAVPGVVPDPIVFGHEHLQVLRTPGHTAGCISFLWRDRLFCGGVLAVDACPHQPRPALPKALWHSVTHEVFTLASETLLFSGHARFSRAVSTVLEQRRWHPWFSGASRDEFLRRVATLPPLQAQDSELPPHPLADDLQ